MSNWSGMRCIQNPTCIKRESSIGFQTMKFLLGLFKITTIRAYLLVVIVGVFNKYRKKNKVRD